MSFDVFLLSTTLFVYFSHIMDARYHAEKLYHQVRDTEATDNNGSQSESSLNVKDGLREVKSLLLKFLSVCSITSRFKFPEFSAVIYKSSADPIFNAHKAATAFENIENYIWLILSSPWKVEYRSIRVRIQLYKVQYRSIRIRIQLYKVEYQSIMVRIQLYKKLLY